MSKRKKDILPTVLKFLCREMRPALFRPREQGGVGWVKNDCIRTAKMALAVLRAYQIEARHFPVCLLAAEPKVGDYLRQHNRSVFDITVDEAVALGRPKFFRMGRVNPTEATTFDNGWRGHMLLSVRDEYLLDLTLDSANQPDLGIDGLRPMSQKVGKEAIQALERGEGEFWFQTTSGVLITYRGDPDNHGYQTMESWTAWHELHAQILAQCQRRIKEIRKGH